MSAMLQAISCQQLITAFNCALTGSNEHCASFATHAIVIPGTILEAGYEYGTDQQCNSLRNRTARRFVCHLIQNMSMTRC